jgi:hypothetical protein
MVIFYLKVPAAAPFAIFRMVLFGLAFLAWLSLARLGLARRSAWLAVVWFRLRRDIQP